MPPTTPLARGGAPEGETELGAIAVQLGDCSRRENERMASKAYWPREKRWKRVYTRSAKLARAEKLGFDYPRVTGSQMVQRETSAASGGKRNVLFICSKNRGVAPPPRPCGASTLIFPFDPPELLDRSTQSLCRRHQVG